MSQASPAGRLAAEPTTIPSMAVEEFIAVLQRLRGRLVVVIDGARREAPTEAGLGALDVLSDYLVNELNPVLHALALRVYPPLRRLGVAGPGTRTADEQARLLRLTERLATVRAERTRPGERSAVVEDIASLSTALLHRAVRTLPALLDGLADPEAARMLNAAQRTAHAGHNLPHLELHPALL